MRKTKSLIGNDAGMLLEDYFVVESLIWPVIFAAASVLEAKIQPAKLLLISSFYKKKKRKKKHLENIKDTQMEYIFLANLD